MSRRLLLGILVFLTISPLTPCQDAVPAGLFTGITSDQAKEILGPPASVSRQVVLNKGIEQWHYGAPHHVQLTFDVERGEKPILRHIRPRKGPIE